MRVEVMFVLIKHLIFTWFYISPSIYQSLCVVYHGLKPHVSVIQVNQEHFYQHATNFKL